MQHINKIGILGGTFDPIHNGHLHVATTVLEKLGLDEVRLVPCYQAVHREQPLATPAQRFMMTQLACEGYTKLSCDDTEFKRGGKSYMIDTLQTIKKSHIDSQLYLIIGFDAFLNFSSWKNWPGILEIADLVVVKRPHSDNHNDNTQLLLKQYGSPKIEILEINALDISATTIRKNSKEHKDISGMLSIKVSHYIKQEGLYAN